MNLFAGDAPHGVAVREVVMKAGHGRADYLLYVEQSVVGVIEAKPAGTPLSGVEWQSAMYAEGLPADVKLAALTKDGRLPFVFEASGTETHLTNGYDPEPRARRIFNFPKASTLARTLRSMSRLSSGPLWSWTSATGQSRAGRGCTVQSGSGGALWHVPSTPVLSRPTTR